MFGKTNNKYFSSVGSLLVAAMNWMKLFKIQYFQLLEKSDEKLDEISNSDNKADTSESKVDNDKSQDIVDVFRKKNESCFLQELFSSGSM